MPPTVSIDRYVRQHRRNSRMTLLRTGVPMRIRTSLFAISLAVATVVCATPSAYAQRVTNLYSFPGTDSSGNPGFGALVQGREGKLHGTTIGETGTAGSAFAMTTTGRATQQYTFGSDGSNPWAGLTLGTDGNYYGTTSAGGETGNGVLFKLSQTG